MEILVKIFEDAVFAAIAAIGFSAISNPPKIAFKYCALIAAIGHALRYCLTTLWGVHLVWGSFKCVCNRMSCRIFRAQSEVSAGDIRLSVTATDDSGHICISVSSGISDAFGAGKRSRFLPLRLSAAVQWIDMYICRVCDGPRTDDTDIPLQTQIVQCHTRINRLK